MNTRNVIFAAALAAIAMPAAAADRSVDVPVADLDLSQAADRAVLDSRIENAARKACASGMRGVAARQVENECRAQAIADATRQAELAIKSDRDTRLATLARDPGA